MSAQDAVMKDASQTGRTRSPLIREMSVPKDGVYMPSVGCVYDSRMLLHFSLDADDPHPEKPERIYRIWQLLREQGLTPRLKMIPVRPVQHNEALLVHSDAHWKSVNLLQYMTDQDIADSWAYYEKISLYVCQGTTEAARLSCGGVVDACLDVARGFLQRAITIVRPPGHHAEPDLHMGFCFFNNVAVAARVVQEQTKVKKILIVDWDVHHGNGTQKAFYDDPNILFISIHRFENGEFYPCGPEGGLTYCGEGAGVGFNINIPWPCPEMGDADYIYAFQRLVMPIAREFNPEMVIVSSGFDAVRGDQLGECDVTPAGYAHMTWMLAGLAQGRMVVVLEGGYEVEMIAKCSVAVTKVLLGESPGEIGPLVASEEATETVYLVARQQSRYWKTLDVEACEPYEEVEPWAHRISDIFKAHRYTFLRDTYGMHLVPLLKPELEALFQYQVMCSPHFFDSHSLVVFVHEFGNLRIEPQSATTCNADLESSYLLDISKQLVEWTKAEGYALLDINVLASQPPMPPGPKSRKVKPPADPTDDVLQYLWDNYIQLCGAKRILLIGHGPGCKPLVKLADKRLRSISKIVRGVIQVVGHANTPRLPKKEELRTWYLSSSYVVVPADHEVLAMNPRKAAMSHGKIIPIEGKGQPVRLIEAALPGIKQWAKERMGAIPR
ncbi:histone deacetylase complex protein [Flagelloscypha sp. PMI_526]|nr:histone deacetylase complex protein [Flagelloscypha sp. PMI_526]